MKYSVREPSAGLSSDLLIIPVSKSQNRSGKFIPDWLSARSNALVRKTVALERFGADFAEPLLITNPEESVKRILLIGCGKEKELTRPLAEKIIHTIQSVQEKINGKKAHLPVSDSGLFGIADIWLLAELDSIGRYRFHGYKSKSDKLKNKFSEWIFLCENQASSSVKNEINAAVSRTGALAFARDLANTPGNLMTPAGFVREVRKQFRNKKPVKLTVRDGRYMQGQSMGALLAVAAGSKQPPFLLEMQYRSKRKKAKTLMLVGKGITFDSGGISIKPAAKMEDMKFDMAGGAAVAGVMKAVADLQPDVNVTGIIPLAENMLGGSAVKPGDVVTACNGKTIEIINTDAEGRLVLADALAWGVKKFKPDYVIDLATLTGSIVSALADKAAGLFCNDDELKKILLSCGEESYERLWPMPLWDDYNKQLESTVADLKNLGGRWGGSVTAAKFLEPFVDGKPWAHIDIAGTAYDVQDRPLLGKGATGFGVKLLLKFLDKIPPVK